MNRLKLLRKQAGLSQLEFGKKIGAAQNTISNWENGFREIDKEKASEIADYFQVSLDYLYGRTNDPRLFSFDGIENLATVSGGEIDNEVSELLSKLSVTQLQDAKKYLRYLKSQQESP